MRIRDDISPVDGTSVEEMVAACLEGRTLTDAEVLALLRIEDAEQLDMLFSGARTMRRAHFGDKVFLYGFVYFSTWCRNACSFCYYRSSNDEPPRYRRSADEVVDAATRLAESGVDLIDLTMGEDPRYLDDPAALPALVSAVREATGCAIMVSPGVVDFTMLTRLAAVGTDWYALYQESFDANLFAWLRCNQSFQARLEAKEAARRAGLLVEEGLLTGFGESVESIARSVCALRGVSAHQVRAMTFVPQAGTPLEQEHESEPLIELKAIAVMRLRYPDRLIPASLDVDGLAGLAARLNAGANVVTSIIPPHTGLAGVAHAHADIENGARTVAGIHDTLEACGLVHAAPGAYRDWVDAMRREGMSA